MHQLYRKYLWWLNERRERESTLRVETQLTISPYFTIGSAGFWIYYAPHHLLTSDRWDQRIWFCVSDISFATFQEKTYLQVSHGRWQFSPSSTVGTWYIWDMLVIWMSSNSIKTNKIQMVKLTHQMTKLHIVFFFFYVGLKMNFF